jgi:hypothetical protein
MGNGMKDPLGVWQAGEAKRRDKGPAASFRAALLVAGTVALLLAVLGGVIYRGFF